jgi:hypothetical protein
MSPLLFLLLRRIKNGLYRSFKTPVRAGMTVLIGGYLLFAVLAVINSTFKAPGLKLESAAVDPRVVAVVITLAHLSLVLYILPSVKYIFNIFSEIDVANLYPVPLERWRVFRFFLFSRSFLGVVMFLVVIAVYLPFFIRILLPKIFFVIHPQREVLWFGAYLALVFNALAGLMFWRLVIDIRAVFGFIYRYTFRCMMTVFWGGIGICLFFQWYVASVSGADVYDALAASVE